MALPRRSQLFYRGVLALPLCVLGYLILSGRATAYWRHFVPSAARANPTIDPSDFITSFLWLGAVTPLLLAAWEIGKEHTAARRLNYGLFLGLREVVRRAVGRESPTKVEAREEAFVLPPRDNPVSALILGALVAIGIPIFFASFVPSLRSAPALVWLIGTGALMGFSTYCHRRAAAYLREEPGTWDLFRQWRLLNPDRYDLPGRRFIRWQIATGVLLPIWWLGGGALVMFHS